MELNGAAINMNPALIRSITALLPNNYARSEAFAVGSSATDAGRRSLITPDSIALEVGGAPLTIPRKTIDLNVAANWDAVTSTDYSIAANRAGKDIYLYANANRLILSANATVPTGYTADQVRLIGGVHGLCLSVGAIANHPLTGFLTGDILPMSVWDLQFRPTCDPNGMVYLASHDHFVDIYMMSGTGENSRSTFSATMTDSRDWMDFTDDLAEVGKIMLNDPMFQRAAARSNEQTNISGSADPVTTGGHVDTAGRRMISGIGCEDMCGVMWQWLSDQTYRNDDAGYVGAWSWQSLSGKGSTYKQGGTGDAKLLAGGSWNTGANCGSRGRNAHNARWATYSAFGSRGCARRQG